MEKRRSFHKSGSSRKKRNQEWLLLSIVFFILVLDLFPLFFSFQNPATLSFLRRSLSSPFLLKRLPRDTLETL